MVATLDRVIIIIVCLAGDGHCRSDDRAPGLTILRSMTGIPRELSDHSAPYKNDRKDEDSIQSYCLVGRGMEEFQTLRSMEAIR